MGIFQRISDILSANMNELTEKFEDPEKMLKQAIREMEDSIADVTQQTAKAMAHEKTLSRELQRNRAGSEEWQQRAVKAVEAGDDGLARKALARRTSTISWSPPWKTKWGWRERAAPCSSTNLPECRPNWPKQSGTCPPLPSASDRPISA